MNMKHQLITFLALMFLIFGSVSMAQGLDPRTRSEDISGSTISVDVFQNESGHYVYDYTVVNGEQSETAISRIRVYIDCERIDETSFDPIIYTTGELSSSAIPGTYAPVAVISAPGEAANWGVGSIGFASWLVNELPGEQAKVRLISPFPPELRTYDLVPSWTDNDDLYDYSEVGDDQEDIPWIGDFTVTGMIDGPSCFNAPEPPDTEYGAFAGTQKGREKASANALLTYSQPLRNRFSVPSDTEAVEFVIHYAENIEPDSFKASIKSLKKSEAEALFDVVPGTKQTVLIPLAKHKETKVKLEANGTCVDDEDDDTQEHGEGKGSQGDCKQKSSKKGEKSSKGYYKDKDEFKIRKEK